MPEKKSESKPSQKSNLEKLEYAYLAGNLIKEKPSYALGAMKQFYSNAGLDKDPIIGYAFNDARNGLHQSGSLTNTSVVMAIKSYAQDFEKSYELSTVSDILSYVQSRGFKDIPQELKVILEKYKTKTFGDMKKASEKDQEAGKVGVALQILLNQIMEGKLFHELVTRSTKSGLESLVAKESE